MSKQSTLEGPKRAVVSDALFCLECGREATQDHNSFSCDHCERLWPKNAGWEVRSAAGEVTELRRALRSVMESVGMFETHPVPSFGKCSECYGETIAPGVNRCRKCSREMGLKILGQNGI